MKEPIMRYRNRGCIPQLQQEGVFLKPILEHPETCYTKDQFERVHGHHTLASARRFAYFKPYRDLIPCDQLDFILNSTYDHSKEEFAERVDCVLQPETRGLQTWRRLQNTIDELPDIRPRSILPVFDNLNPTAIKEIPFKYNQAHPVIISGIKERIDPNYIKLMNSSHHLPQTNAGYTRQPSDGTVFQY